MGDDRVPRDASRLQDGTFQFVLHPTSYNKGLLSIGVDASRSLVEDGDPLIVYLGREADQVDTALNRRAASTRAVRVIDRNRRITKWFQMNFKLGDVVQAKIKDP